MIGFNRDDGKFILTLFNWMACGPVIFNKCTLNHVSNAAKMVALFHFDLFMPAPQEQTSGPLVATILYTLKLQEGLTAFSTCSTWISQTFPMSIMFPVYISLHYKE